MTEWGSHGGFCIWLPWSVQRYSVGMVPLHEKRRTFHGSFTFHSAPSSVLHAALCRNIPLYHSAENAMTAGHVIFPEWRRSVSLQSKTTITPPAKDRERVNKAVVVIGKFRKVASHFCAVRSAL